MKWKWTGPGSEQEVNQKWTGNEPEVNQKWTWMWTSSEHEVNWKWAGSEPEMNWKWAWIEPIVNQKWTGEVEYALQFLKQGYWFTFKIYPPKVSLNFYRSAIHLDFFYIRNISPPLMCSNQKKGAFHPILLKAQQARTVVSKLFKVLNQLILPWKPLLFWTIDSVVVRCQWIKVCT